MKKESIQFIGLVVLSGLFNYFFWQEKLGINLFIFNTLAIILLVFFLFKESLHKRNVQLSLALTLLAGIMVLVHNSFVSKLAYLFSFFILVGFIHQTQLRTIWDALEQYFLNFLVTISEGFKYIKALFKPFVDNNQYVKRFFRNLPLLVIPTLIFLVFFVIFYNANPIFSELISKSLQITFSYFNNLFYNFSLARTLFTISGIYLIFSILFDWNFAKKIKKATSKNDFITPQENLSDYTIKYQDNEYKMALILIVSVNILVGIINAIDINFLWLKFDYSQVENLSKLVHEGTYMLILSIVLSICILLYYFRQGLNFHKNNALLKKAAYVWIIQNIILVISVFIRNYYYINYYGLTHKRIGVAVFLLLSTIGLVTLFLKIKELKSFFYLFRLNSWAWYFALVGLSLANWDVLIARYNLSNTFKNGVDYYYLLSLSDKTLPILYENKEKFPQFSGYPVSVEYRVSEYLKEQQKYTWLSWNIADEQAVTKLNEEIKTETA